MKLLSNGTVVWIVKSLSQQPKAVACKVAGAFREKDGCWKYTVVSLFESQVWSKGASEVFLTEEGAEKQIIASSEDSICMDDRSLRVNGDRYIKVSEITPVLDKSVEALACVLKFWNTNEEVVKQLSTAIDAAQKLSRLCNS